MTGTKRHEKREETQTSANGAGGNNGRTAVAAPPRDPFDRLFALLDGLDADQMRAFVERFRARYG